MNSSFGKGKQNKDMLKGESMIQVLGLRKTYSEKKQQDVSFETFFEKGWRSDSVPSLFKNIDAILKKVPEKEKFNLYYTAAICLEETGRKFVSQQIIPFDIDGIDVENRKAYVPIVLSVLKLEEKKTGVVFSGNGLQIIVGLKKPFTKLTHFKEYRPHYKAVCSRITAALKKADLTGVADPAVWSPARLLRLPNTLNIKPGKPERLAELMQGNIEPSNFSLTECSRIPIIKKGEHITPEQFEKYPDCDDKSVLESCLFLKHCKRDQDEVHESMWYALLSILGRMKEGRKLAHTYSCEHPSYTIEETDEKLNHALDASGPRTCKNIEAMWAGCEECPEKGKVRSPILIRGEDYIATRNTGFHSVKYTDKGKRVGKPCYEDLRRYFESLHPYVTYGESRICFVWNGKHWESFSDVELEGFSQAHFKPTANNAMCMEFRSLVCRTNLRSTKWFQESVERKMNFQNGVLDIDTMELQPHSIKYGFRYVLPYDYDAEAQCPKFIKFLQEVTGDDANVIKVLMEFGGYLFSNDECWTDKAMIMTGEGANGKSTFMNVLRAAAGRDNYSSLTLGELKTETNRYQLDGKLFNLAEETPHYSMTESSLFKNLVTGGETLVKQLYKQPYTIQNRCKLMFACNELPKSRDTTKGFFRRLLIVPFTQEFEGKKCDPFLKAKLLEELPGVFNLILDGYKRLKEQKGFTKSSSIDKEISKYQLATNSVQAWFLDMVHVDEKINEDAFTPVQALYSNYKFFTERRGEKPETMITFGKRIKRLIPKIHDRYKRKPVEGKKTAVMCGVRVDNLQNF